MHNMRDRIACPAQQLEHNTPKPVITCLFFTLFVIGNFALTETPAHAEHPTLTPTPFEQIKTLIGTWHGTRKAYDGDETITARYSLTAKDTAVMEQLYPDTPKEMVSVYTQDGHDLVMTHYCMLGNQPRMRAQGLTPSKSITLTYMDSTGMRSAHDMHMHEVTITIMDESHMTHHWTLYDKGKKKVTHTFMFTRQ
jgi:hypothetical protein